MKAEEARKEIARRAGVTSGDVPVFFDPTKAAKPPTLQRVRRDRVITTGKGKHGRTERRVIVGREWLRQHAPELWAAFVAARLRDDRDDMGHIPSNLLIRS